MLEGLLDTVKTNVVRIVSLCSLVTSPIQLLWYRQKVMTIKAWQQR